MILYLSSATSYTIFDEKFDKGEISGVNPAQRFNYNLIRGLSECAGVTAISALPVNDCDTERIYLEEDGVKYICVGNKKGRLRKLFNGIRLRREVRAALKENRADFIVCDAMNLTASIVVKKAAKKFKIPCAALVTDIPGLMLTRVNIHSALSLKFIKKYDAYILLTEAMNEIVNPRNKPYLVMEGTCVPQNFEHVNKSEKKICLYSGALWRDAGILEMMNGFVLADIGGAELHIYGDGEYREKIEEFCKTHKNVRYKGCISNEAVMEKQREATLLINPRRSDLPFAKYSFPSKTMEYMLSGTPVLTTRLSGIPTEYRQYLYFIEEETEQGFAKAFREVLGKEKEEFERMGEAAKRFVTENKSNIVQSKRIYAFLHELKDKKI